MISVWYKDNLSSLFWSFLSLHDKRPNFVCWWRPFHVKLWKKPSVELQKLFCQAVWFHYPFFLTLDPVSLKLPCLISLQLVIYYNPQNAFGKLYYSRVGGNSNQRGKQSSKELFYLQTWSLTHTLTCSKLPLSLLHCFSVCMIRKKHFLSSETDTNSWRLPLMFYISDTSSAVKLCCICWKYRDDTPCLLVYVWERLNTKDHKLHSTSGWSVEAHKAKILWIFIDAVKSSNEIFNTFGTFRVSPNEGDNIALVNQRPAGTLWI